jgi:Recombinase zinc beta ribbon domain
VAEQLAENRQHARQGQRGVRYLLQGLVCCQQCGYAYYGKAISPSARKGHPRDYAYYRCLGSDAYRFGGERVCTNRQVRTDLLEQAVWQQVCALLQDPSRLAQEYQRRLQEPQRPENRVLLTPVLNWSGGEDTSVAQVVVKDLQLDRVPQSTPGAGEDTVEKLVAELGKRGLDGLPHLRQ